MTHERTVPYEPYRTEPYRYPYDTVFYTVPVCTGHTGTAQYETLALLLRYVLLLPLQLSLLRLATRLLIYTVEGIERDHNSNSLTTFRCNRRKTEDRYDIRNKPAF